MIFTNLHADAWKQVGETKEKGLFDFDFITVQGLYGSAKGKLQNPKRKRVFDMNTYYADQDL